MTPEHQLQFDCVSWFNNAYPQLRGLLFEVNNNSVSGRDGAIRLSRGMVAGVSDLLFIYGGTVYCFELKVENGRQSKAQKAWQKAVEGQGVNYYIIYIFEEFSRQIADITGINGVDGVKPLRFM